MIYRNQHIKIFLILFIVCINLIFSTQVQLITAHKKSNGVLLRIVTNSIVDIENIRIKTIICLWTSIGVVVFWINRR